MLLAWASYKVDSSGIAEAKGGICGIGPPMTYD